MVYREPTKPPTKKQVKKLAETFEALLKANEELLRDNEYLKNTIKRLEEDTRAMMDKIRKYEGALSAIHAGGTIQLQLTQLRNAYAGAKEQIAHLEHTRDVAIGLIRASLAGADPGEVGLLVEQLRATGRAHGIDLKALPAPEPKK